jgi:hypothetical protein
MRKADREAILKTRGRKMRKNSYIVVCNEFLLCYLGLLVRNFLTCTEDNFDTVTGIAVFIRKSSLYLFKKETALLAIIWVYGLLDSVAVKKTALLSYMKC